VRYSLRRLVLAECPYSSAKTWLDEVGHDDCDAYGTENPGPAPLAFDSLTHDLAPISWFPTYVKQLKAYRTYPGSPGQCGDTF
jgi:hypothetical protein